MIRGALPCGPHHDMYICAVLQCEGTHVEGKHSVKELSSLVAMSPPQVF